MSNIRELAEYQDVLPTRRTSFYLSLSQEVGIPLFTCHRTPLVDVQYLLH